MLYRYPMLGTYVGAIEIDDSEIGSGYVLVSQVCRLKVKFFADNPQDGLQKVCSSADNAVNIEILDPVDNTLQIANNATQYASNELIAHVQRHLNQLKRPYFMRLDKHSLIPDPRLS